MSIFQNIVLGAVQGITEFLPISSSAHLVLVPYFSNWDYQGLGFDVALHFGTVIAIIGYFFHDWKTIIKNAFLSNCHPERSEGSRDSSAILQNDNHRGSKLKLTGNILPTTDDQRSEYPKNFLWQILVASIPAALVGLFLVNYVENYLHSPLLLAINLGVFGIILWLADKYSSTTYKLQPTSYKLSAIVGLAQAIALVPGVSRSGITMTAGRALGLSRESSARFSFLLGTPTILGAFALKLSSSSISFFSLPFLLGTLSSTIFGFLAIKYLLQYLRRGNFLVFTIYRVVLAIIVLAMLIAK